MAWREFFRGARADVSRALRRVAARSSDGDAPASRRREPVAVLPHGKSAIALASYARQARDPKLLNLAAHIKFRANRRMGALIREVQPQPGQGGGRPSKKTSARGRAKVFGRNKAARDAGVSRRQQAEALLVAGIPQDIFDELVTREKPPTPAEIKALGGTETASMAVASKRAARRPGLTEARSLDAVIDNLVRVKDRIDLRLAVAWFRGGEQGEREKFLALVGEARGLLTSVLMLDKERPATEHESTASVETLSPRGR